MGQLVVIEGVDGSGKGTQTARLAAAMRGQGLTVSSLSFPRYEETFFGRRIGDFLNGAYGELHEVSPFLTALLYAGDRFESRELLTSALEANDVVLLDRYVSSNVAYQTAKVAASARTQLRTWIEHVEHAIYALPRPGLILWLDVPVAVSQDLVSRKAARSYTDKSADLHEANGGFLATVAEVYRDLAASGEPWRRVDCVEGGTLRAPESITAELLRAVTEKFSPAR